MAFTITKTTNGSLKIDDTVIQKYVNRAFVIQIYPRGDDVIISWYGGDRLITFVQDFNDIAAPAGASAQAKCDAIEAL